MADAPISEELTVLRKRARRRLVGAVALVFMALIALWTVMDDRPPQSLLNQPVDIVSSSPGLSSTVPAAPKPQQTLPAPALPAAEPVPVVATPTPAPQVVPSSVPTPAVTAPVVSHEPVVNTPPALKPDTAKPAEKPTEKPPKPMADPARILAGMDEAPAAKPKPAAKPATKPEAASGDRYFVQLGAFADKDKAAGLVTKAKQAGVSIQTELVSTDKGSLTRLRAGPFASREAADKVRTKLAGSGVTSTVVGK